MHSLRGPRSADGHQYRIRVVRAEHHPQQIKQLLEIDLMTFSVPTFSRYTAGLMLRHGRTFLMLADEQVIGTCGVVRSFDRPSEAVIFSHAIRPGWRGRGLGTRFLKEVLMHLREDGMRSAIIDVEPDNVQAIRIYEDRFGFEQVGVEVGLFGVGEDRMILRRIFQPAERSQS